MVSTFADVLEDYWRKVIPTKAPLTQVGNEAEKQWLLKFFNDPPAPLDAIEPSHIRKYMDWRVKEAKKAAELRNDQRRKEGKAALPIPPKLAQTPPSKVRVLRAARSSRCDEFCGSVPQKRSQC